MLQKFLIVIVLLFIPLLSFCQKERASIREGNENYESNEYKKAEEAYKKALRQNKESFEAAFNLGNSLYKQGRYLEAAQQFEKLSTKAVGKDQKAKVFHNYGNALLKSELIVESVNAYKLALKQNSELQDSRYNLAYALSLLSDAPIEPQSIPEETEQILQQIEEEENKVKRKMREAKTSVQKAKKDW